MLKVYYFLTRETRVAFLMGQRNLLGQRVTRVMLPNVTIVFLTYSHLSLSPLIPSTYLIILCLYTYHH